LDGGKIQWENTNQDHNQQHPGAVAVYLSEISDSNQIAFLGVTTLKSTVDGIFTIGSRVIMDP